MAIGNSLNNSKSRYTQGGTTEALHRRLGWWERTLLVKSSADIRYTVTNKTARRPDLIAFEIYKDPTLQWLVLQYNNIIDINEEIVENVELLLPATNRLSSILGQPLGGV